jgi:hypothetical protein
MPPQGVSSNEVVMLDDRRQGSGVGVSGTFSRTPVLVTGAPRSGSTWVGNVLALAPGTGYVHEPFNRHCPRGVCRAGLTSFAYITEENEAPYLAPLGDTLAWRYSTAAELRGLRTPRGVVRLARDFAYFEAMRQRQARVILKDPLALFSADWIARRFAARVVVIIRHPAAFVASMRAARWRISFHSFSRQPRLIEDRLAPYADAIAAALATPPDAIATYTLLWMLLHHQIDLLREEHPDWIFVRHEDLSREPATEFRVLFDKLGLEFSDGVRASLERFTTDQSPLGKLTLFGNKRRTMRDSRDSMHAFRRRLSAAEIERIRRIAEPLWPRFYGPEDW